MITRFKVIALLSLLAITIGACKNKVKDQIDNTINLDTRSIFDNSKKQNDSTPTESQPDTTLNTSQNQDNKTIIYSSSVYYHRSSSTKEKTNRHGYAERKKTDELEEEYYDVFGDNYLYLIDDEEYEAGEQEYDYDD